MRVNIGLPKERSGGSVNGVDVSGSVTEIGRAAVRRDGYGRFYCGGGLVRPVDAAALRVEPIDRAVLASDEHATGYHRRLAKGGPGARKAEGPLQFELANRVAIEARGARRLEPGVEWVHSPAVPHRVVFGNGRFCGADAGAAVRHGNIRGSVGGGSIRARQVFGHSGALGRAEEIALRLHDARLEGPEDRVAGHLTEHLGQRSASAAVRPMAGRAFVLEDVLRALGPACRNREN